MAEITHHVAKAESLSVVSSSSWAEPTNPCAISGSDLSSETKYLIIAQGVLAGSNNGDDYGMRITTVDDPTIAVVSEMRMQPTYTSAGQGKGYFFTWSFTTDTTPADIQFEVVSHDGTNGYVEGLKLVVIEIGELDDTGYFDGSVTDEASVWAGDSYIADGSTATQAATSTSNGYLEVDGNTLPSTGDPPCQVEIRYYYQISSYISSGTFGVYVLDNGTQIWSDTIDVNAVRAAGWSDWFTVTPPSGGWTAAKASACEFQIEKNSGVFTLGINKIEVRSSTKYAETINTTSDPIGTTPGGDILARIETDSRLIDGNSYAVLGFSQIDVLDNKSNFNTRLWQYADSNVQRTYASEEGEISDELRVFGYFGYFTMDDPSSAGDSIDIQGWAGAASDWTKLYAYLIALDSSAFAGIAYAQGTSSTSITDASYVSLQTATPDGSDADHLFLGRLNHTSGTSGRLAAFIRLSDDTNDVATTTGAVNGYIYGGSGTYEAQGQSVTPGTSQTVHAIRVGIGKTGNPTDGLICKVWTGSPGGTLVATSVEVPNWKLVDVQNPTYFYFVDGFSVTASTVYYFTIERTGSRDTSNYYYMFYNTSSTYADGQRYEKASGSWSAQTGEDAVFGFPATSVAGGAALYPPINTTDVTKNQTQDWDTTDAQAAQVIGVGPSSGDTVQLRADAYSGDTLTSEYEVLIILSLELAGGTPSITPGLASQLAQAFNPTITTGSVSITPGLAQSLVAAFDPTVAATYPITPDLAQSLVTAFDPTLTVGSVSILPGLAQSLASAFDPTLAYTYPITPDLAQQLVAAFNPSLAYTYSITPDLAQSLVTAFDPTVASTGGTQNITPGLVSQLVQAFDPTLTYTYAVTPDLAQSLVTAFDPTLTTGSVSILPDFAQQLAAAFDPTLAVGSVSILPDLAQSLVTAYDPTLTYEYTVGPDLAQSLITVFDPTVTVGSVAVLPDLAQSLTTAFDPTVVIAQKVYPDFAQQLITAFDPSLVLDTQYITPDLVQQLTAPFDPTLAVGSVSITPDLAQSLVTAFDPTVAAGVWTISPDLAQQLAAAFDPTVTVGSVSVNPDLAQSLTTAFNPTLTYTYAVTPDLAQQLTTAFDPTITYEYSIGPDLAESLVTAFDPIVSTGDQIITPDLAQNLAVAFDPSIATGSVTVTPDLAQQLAQAFDPTLAVGSVNIAPDIAQQFVTAFNPTLDVGSVSVTPDLAQSLTTAFDPTLAYEYTVGPDLAQQLIQTFDPTVVLDTQYVYPDLVSQIIVTFDPNVAMEFESVYPELAVSLITAFDPVVMYWMPTLRGTTTRTGVTARTNRTRNAGTTARSNLHGVTSSPTGPAYTDDET